MAPTIPTPETPAAPDVKSHWIPLEANPEVLNAFTAKLGVIGYSWVDVYGLDPELLAMVPSGAIAIVLLFPVTPKYEEYRAQEHARLFASTSTPATPAAAAAGMYIPQTIGNACGTMAVLHAVLNNTHKPGVLMHGSLLHTLHTDLGALAVPADRAAYLDKGKGHMLVGEAHGEVAVMGQSATPDAEDDVDLHFVAFVAKGDDEAVVEFDGRKAGPVVHEAKGLRPVSEHLLDNVVHVVKEFMARDPENIQFTLMALVPEA
ncbi:hypothetical protein BCR44DRAFT_35099, partial [Catenaria anguillulae PL171]